MTNAYFRGSHGILLVYDITNETTYSSISKWLEEVDKHAPSNAIKMVIGNKSDLKTERKVDSNEAQVKKKKNSIYFFIFFFNLFFYIFLHLKKKEFCKKE